MTPVGTCSRRFISLIAIMHDQIHSQIHPILFHRRRCLLHNIVSPPRSVSGNFHDAPEAGGKLHYPIYGYCSGTQLSTIYAYITDPTCLADEHVIYQYPTYATIYRSTLRTSSGKDDANMAHDVRYDGINCTLGAIWQETRNLARRHNHQIWRQLSSSRASSFDLHILRRSLVAENVIHAK
eukprot:1282916-Pleurochrysis_carterae.AAC.1